MASSSVTIGVGKDFKEGASHITERFGFDPPSVTRVFSLQPIRENRIPLNLSDLEPNTESLDSIREADAIIAEGGPGYSSAEEMFAAMGL